MFYMVKQQQTDSGFWAKTAQSSHLFLTFHVGFKQFKIQNLAIIRMANRQKFQKFYFFAFLDFFEYKFNQKLKKLVKFFLYNS